MKNVICGVLLVWSFVNSNLIAQNPDIQEIKKHIEVLSSDEFQGRETGSSGIEKAANYISNFFKSNELKPYYETHIDTFYIKGKTPAYNIIAKIDGTDPYLKNEPVIIGAHYDHIGIKKSAPKDSIYNGANDNVSGTVGVMQLAKKLKDSQPKRSILFILFDAEEQGLKGSKYLAEKLKSEDVNPYIVFNIEMIGVPLIDKPKKVYLTGYKKSNFAQYFNQYAENEILTFSPVAQQYKLFKRSDNYPFYKSFNMPAHSVSSFDFNNYEYYHHVKDEAQLQDAKHISELVDLWTEPLIKISNHIEKLIKLED